MSFKNPQKILATINQMVRSDAPRARNRVRINEVFNGEPPFSAQEAEENQIHTNVNFLEGTEIMHSARSQFSNAFQKPANYFSVAVEWGAPHKRVEWGHIVTREINRIMKRSLRYKQVLENVFAGVVLHGIGPRIWMRDRDWCPEAKGVDEVLVPSRTLTDLTNLEHFCIRRTFTITDLIKRTAGDGSKIGWNMPVVKATVERLRELSMNHYSDDHSRPDLFPESFEEDIKENAGFWASDAVPAVRCYDFYYRDTDTDNPVWRRKILIDVHANPSMAGPGAVSDPLLFDPKYSYGDDITQLLHVQFADGANKPPFRWHSVRSLGYMLYAVCHLQNRLRCKLNDAVFESMLWYFYDLNSGDEERLRRVDLHHLGVIPDGLKWVPQDERHTVNYELVAGAVSMHRQLMSEKSSSFTQDVNDGTQKEMSATEAIGRINAASAMVGSMLSRAYDYETIACREVVRRFFTIDHKDCKRFRERCEEQGVPKELWKLFDEVDVTVERTLGNGNKTLEILQADRLRAMKNDAEVSPDARRMIDRLYVLANTDNPQLAQAIIPDDPNQPSRAQQFATLAWGTLIAGQPVVITDAISKIDYVRTLLQMLASELQRINGSGGNPEMEEVLGLANVVQHIASNLEIIATDEGIADMVRAFEDALGQASNQIKGYAQRAQEAQQQEAGGTEDPELAARVQAMIIQAQAKAKVTEAGAEQKRRLKQVQFEQEQQRKDVSTMADIQRKGAQAHVDIAKQVAMTHASIAGSRATTAADIQAQNAQTIAQIAREDASTPKKPE